jgi:hypothetical protein
MSSEFGSKAMRGYFVKHGSICLVTIMVVEKGDLDRPTLSTELARDRYGVRAVIHRPRSAGKEAVRALT